MDRSEENRAIDGVVDRLAKLFPKLPAEEVAAAVSQVQPEFDDAPIREFVPLFVERSAKARLQQSTDVGIAMSSPTSIGQLSGRPGDARMVRESSEELDRWLPDN
jgi:hypothetical protein